MVEEVLRMVRNLNRGDLLLLRRDHPLLIDATVRRPTAAMGCCASATRGWGC